MNTRDAVAKYYEYANAGDWDAWCGLFAEDQVMDEQLAGHIEGLATLRTMMAGMDKMYRVFQNQPVRFLVDGEHAAAVSHLVAESVTGKPVTAEVMNYFRIVDGRIAYMANYHDTMPFQVLSQV